MFAPRELGIFLLREVMEYFQRGYLAKTENTDVFDAAIAWVRERGCEVKIRKRFGGYTVRITTEDLNRHGNQTQWECIGAGMTDAQALVAAMEQVKGSPIEMDWVIDT